MEREPKESTFQEREGQQTTKKWSSLPGEPNK